LRQLKAETADCSGGRKIKNIKNIAVELNELNWKMCHTHINANNFKSKANAKIVNYRRLDKEQKKYTKHNTDKKTTQQIIPHSGMTH